MLVACFIIVFVVGVAYYREVERSVKYAHGYVVYESLHRKKNCKPLTPKYVPSGRVQPNHEMHTVAPVYRSTGISKEQFMGEPLLDGCIGRSPMFPSYMPCASG